MTTDKTGIQLYNVSMALANPVPVARPYESAGIGSDTADNELYAFFENIPREKRPNVDRIDGLTALLYATYRAGVRNHGVGGTPHIAIIKGNELILPEENSSKLGVEVVRAARSGFVGEAFKREALDGLMYKNAAFDAIDKAMWSEAKKLEKDNSLGLMLRGYKV